jgi:hypothetical protein
VGKNYPGFKRYLEKTFSSDKKPERGVSTDVTDAAIYNAITARHPDPLIRVGGPEVYSAYLVIIIYFYYYFFFFKKSIFSFLVSFLTFYWTEWLRLCFATETIPMMPIKIWCLASKRCWEVNKS